MHHLPDGYTVDIVMTKLVYVMKIRNPVDNFGTVVGENPTPYGTLALWAVNGLSIVYWEIITCRMRLEKCIELILNPGSLSSEDFLTWACLIEKGSSYLQLSGPAQIHNSSINIFQTPTLNTGVSSSLYQSMTILLE